MSKSKKIYCIASFVLAIMALIICLMLCGRQSVYATARDEVGRFNSATRQDDTAENYNDGLWVQWGNEEGTISAPIRMMIVLTVLSLAPSIMILLTSFTRIVIVLHFIRTALGTQTTPPNQVMAGLAIFLTLMIMSPVFTKVNEEALQPYDQGEITFETALERAEDPFREFMYPKTKAKDINMFCDIAGITYEAADEIPFTVLVPSFIISELQIGRAHV